MQELILYAVLFSALLGHSLLAGKMYREVHENTELSIREKNNWKLRALVFPGYFWFKYKKSKSGL